MVPGEGGLIKLLIPVFGIITDIVVVVTEGAMLVEVEVEVSQLSGTSTADTRDIRAVEVIMVATWAPRRRTTAVDDRPGMDNLGQSKPTTDQYGDGRTARDGEQLQ